jgi:hypothetical protein
MIPDLREARFGAQARLEKIIPPMEISTFDSGRLKLI